MISLYSVKHWLTHWNQFDEYQVQAAKGTKMIQVLFFEETDK